jgi:hypothetical protein
MFMKKLDISKFKSAQEVHTDWMKDPEYRRELLQPEYQIARQMIGARLKNKMSQKDLAKKQEWDKQLYLVWKE